MKNVNKITAAALLTGLGVSAFSGLAVAQDSTDAEAVAVPDLTTTAAVDTDDTVATTVADKDVEKDADVEIVTEDTGLAAIREAIAGVDDNKEVKMSQADFDALLAGISTVGGKEVKLDKSNVVAYYSVAADGSIETELPQTAGKTLTYTIAEGATFPAGWEVAIVDNVLSIKAPKGGTDSTEPAAPTVDAEATTDVEPAPAEDATPAAPAIDNTPAPAEDATEVSAPAGTTAPAEGVTNEVVPTPDTELLADAPEALFAVPLRVETAAGTSVDRYAVVFAGENTAGFTNFQAVPGEVVVEETPEATTEGDSTTTETDGDKVVDGTQESEATTEGEATDATTTTDGDTTTPETTTDGDTTTPETTTDGDKEPETTTDATKEPETTTDGDKPVDGTQEPEATDTTKESEAAITTTTDGDKVVDGTKEPETTTTTGTKDTVVNAPNLIDPTKETKTEAPETTKQKPTINDISKQLTDVANGANDVLRAYGELSRNYEKATGRTIDNDVNSLLGRPTTDKPTTTVVAPTKAGTVVTDGKGVYTVKTGGNVERQGLFHVFFN